MRVAPPFLCSGSVGRLVFSVKENYQARDIYHKHYSHRSIILLQNKPAVGYPGTRSERLNMFDMVSRRGFVSLSGASVAGFGLAGCSGKRRPSPLVPMPVLLRHLPRRLLSCRSLLPIRSRRLCPRFRSSTPSRPVPRLPTRSSKRPGTLSSRCVPVPRLTYSSRPPRAPWTTPRPPDSSMPTPVRICSSTTL